MVEWKPTIAVVGAGAMGCLFGGLLAEGGLDVTLIDVWQEHVDRINRVGLRIVGYGGDRTIPVRATTDPSGLEAVDVLFVQCKAPYTKEAVRRVLHLLREDSVAISFQNGLGNEENIGAVIGMKRVLGGVTAQGAAVEGPGAVRNFGDLPTHIGEMPGGLSERSQRIAAALDRAGLQTTASSDIRQAIWKKLLANIAVSPTSAIANMTIKQVFAVPELKETAFEALDEGRGRGTRRGRRSGFGRNARSDRSDRWPGGHGRQQVQSVRGHSQPASMRSRRDQRCNRAAGQATWHPHAGQQDVGRRSEGDGKPLSELKRDAE